VASLMSRLELAYASPTRALGEPPLAAITGYTTTDITGDSRGTSGRADDLDPFRRVRHAYPDATYRRLAEIKARWDPANVLHRNQNIRPS